CFVICFNLFFCFSEKRLASHFFCFSLSSLYTNQSISSTIIFLKVCNNCLSPPSKVFSYALLGLAFLLFLFACSELFFLWFAIFFDRFYGVAIKANFAFFQPNTTRTHLFYKIHTMCNDNNCFRPLHHVLNPFGCFLPES